VARALVETFFRLRDHPREPVETPDQPSARQPASRSYLPIHVVRATAAAETGTAREVSDRALEALALGALDIRVRVRLLAARYDVPPRSEPMYARGGTRALMLTMTRADDRTADGSSKEDR
jgi:hypothetical protein